MPVYQLVLPTFYLNLLIVYVTPYNPTEEMVGATTNTYANNTNTARNNTANMNSFILPYLLIG